MQPPLSVLLLLLLLSLLPSSLPSPTTYIVLNQPTRFPTLQTWYASALQQLHHDQEDQPGPAILHTYTTTLYGFAATLTAQQASALESRAFVLAVLPDQENVLHTMRSPEFLGLENQNSRLLMDFDAGKDVVIAAGVSEMSGLIRGTGVSEMSGLGRFRPGGTGRVSLGRGLGRGLAIGS